MGCMISNELIASVSILASYWYLNFDAMEDTQTVDQINMHIMQFRS